MLTQRTCTQACVLAFLAPHDLAHFSEASRICHSAAIRDLLWRPWLTMHFGDVKSWAMWGSTPALQYSALALAPCSVCNQPLLRLDLVEGASTRYPRPHSCDIGQCELLCCAAHHCGCRCLTGYSCTQPPHPTVLTCTHCKGCKGWAHRVCDQIQFECMDCRRFFCDPCSFECDVCCCSFCKGCRAWDVILVYPKYKVWSTRCNRCVNICDESDEDDGDDDDANSGDN